MRSRIAFLACVPPVVLLGLASRRYGATLHEVLAAYSGDTLYAVMIYLLVGAAIPQIGLKVRAAAALTACFTIEVSQLYHGAWIDSLRHTALGGLVLGFGFLWSDVVCYAVGVCVAGACEYTIRRLVPARARRSPADSEDACVAKSPRNAR
jgi:hypothetical protein